MPSKDKDGDISYDQFGRRGVHDEQLESIVRFLSKEIVTHCVRVVPPSEGLPSLIANINSVTMQVIAHLIHYVTADQHDLREALIALGKATNGEGNGQDRDTRRTK